MRAAAWTLLQVAYGQGSSGHGGYSGYAASTYAAVAPTVATLPEGVSQLDVRAPSPLHYNVAKSLTCHGTGLQLDTMAPLPPHRDASKSGTLMLCTTAGPFLPCMLCAAWRPPECRLRF